MIRCPEPALVLDKSICGRFPEDQRSVWFLERYEDAANQVIEFLGGDFITLTGRSVADIGCGDGIIDLGVAHKCLPARLIGFDTKPTDRNWLLEVAREQEVAEELPGCLEFVTCHKDRIPAEDHIFDYAFSWSAFDHVDDPVVLIREVHRILRPAGVLMIQLYPFYHSQHGSHLSHWYPEGFAQFLHDDHEIEEKVRSFSGPDREWGEAALSEYRTLNKLTLDGLQGALDRGGFRVTKLELITGSIHIPAELSKVPLSRLAVEGAKLLAVPKPDRYPEVRWSA
jgi:SAM-dependent methyltransferase